VRYRASTLAVLCYLVEQNPEVPEAKALAKHKCGEELDDAVFRAVATIPLRWIPEGGLQVFPFDGEDFINRVEQ
jgi:hypothetical protein